MLVLTVCETVLSGPLSGSGVSVERDVRVVRCVRANLAKISNYTHSLTGLPIWCSSCSGYHSLVGALPSSAAVMSCLT